MSEQSISVGKRGRQNRQSRFQRLWAQAEALAAENVELESTLDALVSRIDTEVIPAELELGKAIRQVVDKQLDFSLKKTLTQWQRHELSEWIDDHIGELLVMGLVDESLKNRLAERQATAMGIELDPNGELSAADQLEQYFEEDAARFREQYFGDGDGDEDHLDADDTIDFDEDDDISEDELIELLRRLNGEAETSEHELPDRSPASFDDAVFKRLFRQTAAALHPDKESNADRQLEKHELMARLLKARRNHDLITILRLHEEHAVASTELSVADEKRLEGVLQHYLDQQQTRTNEIVHKSGMHHMVFTQFYDKKPALVKRRITQHLRKTEEKRKTMLAFLDEVKTLKRLKELLSIRYDAYRERWF